MGSVEPKIGYESPAAPLDAWRVYDSENPEPGYFEFDWISARHPDLYHRFALSTDGLIEELPKLVDLTGLDVVDIGAGTGRSTLGAAKTARHVYAVDAYASVVEFGRNEVEKAGLTNATYLRGDNTALPLGDNSVDVALAAFAAFDPREVYRVLKPGGRVVYGACAPGSLMGELTEVLSPSYQDFVSEVAPCEVFEPGSPAQDTDLDTESWNGIPVQWMKLHDFTHVGDFGDSGELAAILGRIYGPVAENYARDNGKSTLAYRLRIYYGQVAK
jgi:ubiquinone/menaquinone biosynthesis C-methylase UbiE